MSHAPFRLVLKDTDHLSARHKEIIAEVVGKIDGLERANATLIKTVTLITEERGRLVIELDEVAGEAMDAATKNDHQADEIQDLKRQRAWLLASWGVLVVAATLNALSRWWLT